MPFFYEIDPIFISLSYHHKPKNEFGIVGTSSSRFLRLYVKMNLFFVAFFFVRKNQKAKLDKKYLSKNIHLISNKHQKQ